MEKDNQLLRDPAVFPSDEVIAAALGQSYKTYAEFLERAAHEKITLTQWCFYNDGKAWLTKGEFNWTTERGTKKVKPLFWLSVWNGFFKVTFFFSPAHKEELLSLELSGQIKKAVANASPLGKTMRIMPVVLEVNSETELKGVFLLAHFKRDKA